MNLNLIPFLIVGAILLCGVIAMVIWRKVISSHEDDSIHVLADESMVPEQVAVAQKLAVIDRWGKVLTAVTVIYVLGVLALYVYQVWLRANSPITL